jgi:hypothetical protein
VGVVVRRIQIVLLATLGLGARGAWAACGQPSDTVELSSSLEAAQGNYAELDVAGFREAMDDARRVLPCLRDPITRHLAAEMHRFEGLLAFVDRQPARSTTAFAAARAIEPNYRFPESIVPSGNPVLEDYEALDPDAAAFEAVAEPVDGSIQFDGRPSAQRATAYPTLVQLVDASGRVTTTTYLWPGDPLPAYEARPGPLPVPMPDRSGDGNVSSVGTGSGGSSVINVVDRGPNVPLLAGAIGGLVASGLVYGSAALVHKRYDDPETSFEDLNRLRSTNNGLVLTSGAIAAVSVGVGTTAFFVARW